MDIYICYSYMMAGGEFYKKLLNVLFLMLLLYNRIVTFYSLLIGGITVSEYKRRI